VAALRLVGREVLLLGVDGWGFGLGGSEAVAADCSVGIFEIEI